MSKRKSRMGRPPMPEGTTKATTFCVRITFDERDAIERAAATEGVSVSEWARSALLQAAHNR